MAYGIQVLNEYGEVALDFNWPVLYKYDTGTIARNATLITAGGAQATTDGYSNGFGDRANYSGFGTYTNEEHPTRQPYSMVASESGEYTEVNGSSKIVIHPEFNLQHGDMVFYDVSSYGLLASFLMMNYGFTDSTPNDVGVGHCMVEGDNLIDYTIVSMREPTATPTEDYGVQLFDSSADKVFDSRQDHFQIYDHFYVSKDIMSRVILDGITITLNLSETHSSFRVFSPNHISFYTATGGKKVFASIVKVDSDTIKIEPIDNGGTDSGTTRTLIQDTVIIVGR